jgi:fatty acid desaturase
MGEAKRRKTALGEKYGQDPQIFPWLPITKKQAEQFVNLTTRATWIGIGFLVVSWIIIRFIGPAFGWWEVT